MLVRSSTTYTQHEGAVTESRGLTLSILQLSDALPAGAVLSSCGKLLVLRHLWKTDMNWVQYLAEIRVGWGWVFQTTGSTELTRVQISLFQPSTDKQVDGFTSFDRFLLTGWRNRWTDC